MVWNLEHGQARSAISLESSAPVPEDALGLRQKNDWQITRSLSVKFTFFAPCFHPSNNCINLNSKDIAIVFFIAAPLKGELLGLSRFFLLDKSFPCDK